MCMIYCAGFILYTWLCNVCYLSAFSAHNTSLNLQYSSFMIDLLYIDLLAWYERFLLCFVFYIIHHESSIIAVYNISGHALHVGFALIMTIKPFIPMPFLFISERVKSKNTERCQRLRRWVPLYVCECALLSHSIVLVNQKLLSFMCRMSLLPEPRSFLKKLIHSHCSVWRRPATALLAAAQALHTNVHTKWKLIPVRAVKMRRKWVAV